MTARSKIEWTDRTWNPVTGCTKVSPGCDHCYADSIARRFAGTPAFPNGFDLTLRPERLADPLRWTKPSRVFVNSMSDLFHSAVPDDFVADVFAVMSAGFHVYQVLTKRHGRMRTLLTSDAFRADVERRRNQPGRWTIPGGMEWPLPNVWLGVSVEDQQRADLRIPALIDTPAAVRFLSCEPLLGHIDLARHLYPTACPGGCSCRRPDDADAHECGCTGPCTTSAWRPSAALDWVIVGGESGAGARPMHPAWALHLRDQCTDADVAFFFKQWGNWRADAAAGDPWSGDPPTAWLNETGELVEEEQALRGGSWLGVHRVGKGAAGRMLDRRTWDEFPGGPR